MTTVDLQERLNKAQEKVAKCEATIERHKAQAQKKLDNIIKNGWDPQNAACMKGTSEFWDAAEAIHYYEFKLEDIKSAERKLEEAIQVAENWKTKLVRQQKADATLEKEIPEAFKKAKEHLINKWVEYDLLEKEKMVKARQELDYEEFCKRYKIYDLDRLSHTEEQFREIETKEANLWILDLYNRVKSKTGEITDTSDLYFNGKALNGWVKGVKGTAVVETILAGGYNIQRLHYRVLVK